MKTTLKATLRITITAIIAHRVFKKKVHFLNANQIMLTETDTIRGFDVFMDGTSLTSHQENHD